MANQKNEIASGCPVVADYEVPAAEYVPSEQYVPKKKSAARGTHTEIIRLNVQALNALGIVHRVKADEKGVEIELEVVERAPLLTNEAREAIQDAGGPDFAEMMIAKLERDTLNAMVAQLLTRRY